MEEAIEESGKVDEEGAEVFGAAEVGGASDLLPLAFLGPLNVTVGSSKIPIVLLYICQVHDRAETLQGPGIRSNSSTFTQSSD